MKSLNNTLKCIHRKIWVEFFIWSTARNPRSYESIIQGIREQTICLEQHSLVEQALRPVTGNKQLLNSCKSSNGRWLAGNPSLTASRLLSAATCSHQNWKLIQIYFAITSPIIRVFYDVSRNLKVSDLRFTDCWNEKK